MGGAHDTRESETVLLDEEVDQAVAGDAFCVVRAHKRFLGDDADAAEVRRSASQQVPMVGSR